MDLGFRRYSEQDYGACRALWVELTEHHREIYDDPTIGEPDPGAGVDRYLADLGGGEFWGVKRDGHVVGMSGLPLEGEDGEIKPIVVTRAARSSGIRERLLSHLIARARGHGLRYLSIRPGAPNSRAIARFHASGFRTLGHLEMPCSSTRSSVPGGRGSRSTTWTSVTDLRVRALPGDPRPSGSARPRERALARSNTREDERQSKAAEAVVGGRGLEPLTFRV